MPRIVKTDISPSDQAEIEALGKTQADYEAAKKLVKEWDASFKTVLSRLSVDIPLTAEATILMPEYMIELSAAKKARKIKSLQRLIEILGAKTFLDLCKVNITDIVKYVPEHQLPEVLEDEQTETRTPKLIKRA